MRDQLCLAVSLMLSSSLCISFCPSWAHAESPFDESYFPLEDGNSWIYSYGSGVSQGKERVRITGRKAVGSYSSAMFETIFGAGGPTIRYFADVKDPFDGIKQMGADLADGSLQLYSTGVYMPFGLTVGQKYEGQAPSVTYSAGGAVQPGSQSILRYSYLRQPDQAVHTAAGDFDCVVLEVTNFWVKPNGTPISAQSSVTQEFYASGVGLVQTRTQNSNWTTTLDSASVHGRLFPVAIAPRVPSPHL